MTQPSSSVPSPCIRNCCLDEQDVCLGCGRSLDEIRLWSESGDAERLAILRRAAGRRAEREARRQAWEAGILDR
ncbi:MAG TPA: DUF1289 domain-containing protein [Gammaproteobacteria bacterium]|nr:DUF1289 domain-containing protein [Gammaproteobacteria bacterium]HEV2332877.1 DUF1289 domain-containing protein [Gammaproteobacteria bacterium]